MRTKEEYLAEAQKIVDAERRVKPAPIPTEEARELHAKIEEAATAERPDVQAVADALEALEAREAREAKLESAAEAVTAVAELEPVK